MQSPNADTPPQQGPSPGALSSAAPSTKPVIALHEVLSLVMPHLALKDRVTVSRVSREWRDAAVRQHHFWRTVDAGKSRLNGIGDLYSWAGTCNVGALKASVAFLPGFEDMFEVGRYRGIENMPTRLAPLLSAPKCTSLTSLHLCIDTSDLRGCYTDELRVADSARSMGIIEFPTSLRQLKFDLSLSCVYRLIPNIVQLTALTALSCWIDGRREWELPEWELPDGYLEGNLPKAFPASLKRLEIYTNFSMPILPPQITSITRLESLQVSNSNWEWQTWCFDWRVPGDLRLLDVQEGKEEHDEWCRHLTYLGFSNKFFTELPEKLPPNLVTVELLLPEIGEYWGTGLHSYSALRQLRRFTYRPLETNSMPEAPYELAELEILKGLKGIEVLDLRGIHSDLIRLPIPTELLTLQSLKHLGIDMMVLSDYQHIFCVLKRLESLKMATEGYNYDWMLCGHAEYEYEVNDDTTLPEECQEGIDDLVLHVLESCPNLKAVYSDNKWLRCIWNVPALHNDEAKYRQQLINELEDEYDVKETPLAIAVRKRAIPLLPEEEWESVLEYGRQWTPWDQVE